MSQQQLEEYPPQQAPKAGVKSQALVVYGRILDVIVTVLIFVMLLTLMGAVAGLVIDFVSATNAMRNAVSTQNLAFGIVDSIENWLSTCCRSLS